MALHRPRRIAITGASGFLGRVLAEARRAAGDHVAPLRRGDGDRYRWDPEKGMLAGSLEDFDVVVHLAGEPIDQRWTQRARRRIMDSRAVGTRRLAEHLAGLDEPPLFVSASAVGYHGDRGDEVLTESSSPGDGFLAEVCQAWETAADPARDAGVTVIHPRTGVVLGDGGVLARMKLPFRLGLGGRIGDGSQYMPWIHIDDWVGLVAFAIDRPLRGPVNVVTGAVTNDVFVHALGQALHRPARMPLPAPAVRLLFGQMGQEMLLGGQRVEPAVARQAGFAWRFPDLAGALDHVVGA